jgi:hypothetical protein
VSNTLNHFEDHPPIGFVSFDMDLYTATRDAMHVLFRGSRALRVCLPRVACYMDEIMESPCRS